MVIFFEISMDIGWTKNAKFENTPIKIQKKFYRTFTLKKTEKDKLLQEKNALHQQMQLVFG